MNIPDVAPLVWAPMKVQERVRLIVAVRTDREIGIPIGALCRIKRNPFTGLSKPGPY